MKVEVKLFATLRLQLGRGALTVETEEPPTVRELLDEISVKGELDIRPHLLDKEGELLVGTMILVGGKNIHHLQGLDTIVDSSEVAIFPPAGGG